MERSMKQADDNDPVRMYLREAASSPPLSEEEERTLWEQVEDPDLAELAKRRLIESRLALVVKIAERHASSELSTLELLQEGNIGLLRAVDTFPNRTTNDFSAHASCIEHAIMDAIAGRETN
jgi:DNA-directed RNA polymerase sigma subunit (sigma70/sigma32)